MLPEEPLWERFFRVFSRQNLCLTCLMALRICVTHLRILANSAIKSFTVVSPTEAECFSITGFILDWNLATSAAGNSVTAMPFFFRPSIASAVCLREATR